MITVNERRKAFRAIGAVGTDAQLDAALYGDQIDWSYLFDPEALYERRGVVAGRLVA